MSVTSELHGKSTSLQRHTGSTGKNLPGEQTFSSHILLVKSLSVHQVDPVHDLNDYFQTYPSDNVASELSWGLRRTGVLRMNVRLVGFPGPYNHAFATPMGL